MVLYVGFFVLMAFWTLLEDVRIAAPRWKLLLRGLGSGLGSAGMILYLLEARSPALVGAWRFVFPFLVLEALVCGAWDLRFGAARLAARERRDEEPPSPEARRRILGLSVAFGLVFAAPYFALNFLFAYGGG